MILEILAITLELISMISMPRNLSHHISFDLYDYLGGCNWLVTPTFMTRHALFDTGLMSSWALGKQDMISLSKKQSSLIDLIVSLSIASEIVTRYKSSQPYLCLLQLG